MTTELQRQLSQIRTGDHLCMLYEQPAELLPAAAHFLAEGLERGEHALYVVDDNDREVVVRALAAAGVDVDRELECGRLRLLSAREYCPLEEFDPRAMLARFRQLGDEMARSGTPGARAAIEMTWALTVDAPLDRLAEYECWGNHIFEHFTGEPFVATKGFLVQVPDRVPYKMETVGDEPSLRFEVSVANASTIYPLDETPVPVPGMEFVQTRIPGRGEYDEQNRPYLDFWKEVVEGGRRGGAFVTDDRGFANIIRGQGAPPAPDTNVGHYHAYGSEFWFIMEGQIDYLIEGEPFFSAYEGDIVYVPAGRYHRASWGGDGMSTRLAINGYPRGLHVWPAH